jgi:DNA polymerase I-like protein with 3'-5' exonuclease and polymerase domains
MNPQKLLNYLLQATETDMNVVMLWDILKMLKGKNTKLVLYVFDSFLLDVDEDEKDIINEILEVFKKYKFNVKMVTGKNYGEMK